MSWKNEIVLERPFDKKQALRSSKFRVETCCSYFVRLGDFYAVPKKVMRLTNVYDQQKQYFVL